PHVSRRSSYLSQSIIPIPTRRSSDLLTLDGSTVATATLTVKTTSQTSSGRLWRGWERLRNGPWPGGPWILWFGAWLAVLASLQPDRKSTRLNSSQQIISYAVFCFNNT